MRILVLMPLDERAVPMSMALWRELPSELQEQTFNVVGYMDYLVQSKLVGNWVTAMFYSLMAAEKVIKATDKNENLIVFGNTNKKYKFDIVLNMQDMEVAEPYKDNFLEEVKSIVLPTNEKPLIKLIDNTYDASASILSLINIDASAALLVDLIKSDNKAAIEELKHQYAEKLELLKRAGNVPTE